MADDPAIGEARQLIRGGQAKKAVAVYERRIQELSAQPKGRPIVHTILAALIVGFMAMTGIILGNTLADNDSPQKQVSPAAAFARDCGAWEWWNYNAGYAADFMAAINTAATRDFSSMEQRYAELILDVYGETMDEMYDKFEAANYPFCAKEARDTVLSGMYFFKGYETDLSLSLFYDMDIDPLVSFQMAQEQMLKAAPLIAELTGEDAGFLIIEDALDQEANKVQP